jgi:hypothetical protein
MMNRFNKHDFIEIQAVTFFYNFFDIRECNLNKNSVQKWTGLLIQKLFTSYLISWSLKKASSFKQNGDKLGINDERGN